MEVPESPEVPQSPEPSQSTEVADASSDELPINNTRLRRFLTLAGLRITARLFDRQGICVPISKNLMVKSAGIVHLAEATTMKFIAEHTSIPVPKVWCSFTRDGCTYIVMERIDGECLSKGWKHRSQESKDKLLAQLKLMMQELRSLKPGPDTGVENCIGGPLQDSRIPDPYRRHGPFKTIHDFHLWLRDDFQPAGLPKPPSATEEDWEDVNFMSSKQDEPWPAPVFTHGDLNPTNILVRGDRIVGIIDWEVAGWYPNYWEYTSAWHSQVLTKEWQEALARFLDVFPEELQMEAIRRKWWGEF